MFFRGYFNNKLTHWRSLPQDYKKFNARRCDGCCSYCFFIPSFYVISFVLIMTRFFSSPCTYVIIIITFHMSFSGWFGCSFGRAVCCYYCCIVFFDETTKIDVLSVFMCTFFSSFVFFVVGWW